MVEEPSQHQVANVISAVELKTNSIGVWHAVQESDGMYDTELAGKRSAITTDGASWDGIGAEAAFNFFQVRMNLQEAGLTRFAGVSVKAIKDPRSGRMYMLISEGSGHKIRMADVTDIKASRTKVTTIASVAGPKELVAGKTPDDVIVWDSNGMVQMIDITPMVPCSNLFKLTRSAFMNWKAPPNVTALDTYLLEDTYDYFLERKAAIGKGIDLTSLKSEPTSAPPLTSCRGSGHRRRTKGLKSECDLTKSMLVTTENAKAFTTWQTLEKGQLCSDIRECGCDEFWTPEPKSSYVNEIGEAAATWEMARNAAPTWKIRIFKKVKKLKLDDTVTAVLMKFIACSTSISYANAQSNCCVEKTVVPLSTEQQMKKYESKISKALCEM